MANAMIGALRIPLSINAGKFASSSKAAGNSLDALAAKAKRLGTNMSRIGAVMSASLTAPIVAFGSSILRAGGDFEKAMNRVQAVSGATAGQFQALKSQAKELGATTQFSASEAADAMGFLAMAGFDANKIVGAMPGTLQLAASAQLDLAQSADIVSNVLTGYSMKVEELGRVNDVLVKTFTRTNTNLVQLGEAMKYAGPVASAAGVQFEESAAAIGLMGNAGIQASMAGTSLRGAISRMLAPTKQMQGIMKQAGLQFTDAKGRLLPLAEIIRRLEPVADDAGLMMELFGLRAGPAMAALVSQGADQLKKLTVELENSGGTAKRIADVQMKGFAGAMKELRSAFEALQIAIAESGLLDFMAKMARRFADVLRNVSKANPTLLKWGAIIAGVVAAIAPLVVSLGLLTIAFGALLPVIATVGGAITALIAGTGPIGLFIAAASLAITAWYGFKDDIIGIWDSVGKFISDKVDQIKNRIESINNALLLLKFGEFSAALKVLGETTTSTFDQVQRASKSAMLSMGGWKTTTETVLPAAAAAVKDDFAKPVGESLSEVDRLWQQHNESARQFGQQTLAGMTTPMEVLIAQQWRLREALDASGLSAEQYGAAMQKATFVAVNAYAGMASSIANNLASAFGESKAFAIAAAVINTAESVTKTLATYGATPWGFAAAASAAAAGLAQIAAIRNTNKGGGGGGRAAAASASPAGNAGAPSSPRQQVSINLQGQNFSREQVRSLMTEMNSLVADGAELQVNG